MEIVDAIAQRHSVRSYIDREIDSEIVFALQQEIDDCEDKSGLFIKLVSNDPQAFGGGKARYGAFEGVSNYIVIAGRRNLKLDEQAGYWGEHLVLRAQMMGLNTCWVGLTYSHAHVSKLVPDGMHIVAVIAIGYGATQGSTHPVKSVAELSSVKGVAPAWFERGMWAAQLAPTALNQQRFTIVYEGGAVKAKSHPGPYANVDLGVVKYHFEVGAGVENVAWAR
jgi:hypothetical protein